MILSKRNSLFSAWISELKGAGYLKINLIFAGVVLLIMGYSGIFSPDRDNYPVVCIHEKITGQQCASCGISHSFSLILRGRIAEAYDWNPYGLRVFLFFAAQLLMRVVFSFFYLSGRNREELILYDITGSIIIFLISFYPFIRQLLQSMLI
jgi:hypothetical protein